MKKFYPLFTKIMGVLYKILPFFIGVYCYYPIFAEQDGRVYPFLDAVYSSIKIYSGAIEAGIPVGALLQLARFMAMAATLSILINAFDKMNAVVNRLKLLGGGSTVVYGDSSYAEYMYKSLNRRARVRGEEEFIRHASRYLIMFSEDARNLEFYNQHYNELKDKKTYIMLNDVSRQNIENPKVTVFSAAEICARQYWRAHPVEKNERIAIVGFGGIGENILLYGLQVNLIDPGQHFEYHVYGDGAAFRREHTELSQMAPDEIIFHDDGIYEFSEMTGFDRVILCGADENDNISALSRLFVCAPIGRPIHVYAPNGDVITNLFGSERVVCFGTSKETATADIIFNERLMEDAKKQHEFYYKKYGGTPWEKLDSFKRYSNVSSSDYMDVIRRLTEKGVPFETIAELEHIRWCRYHYLHNWKYAPETDPARRLHNCLLPFSALSEEERLKDVEAVKSKM